MAKMEKYNLKIRIIHWTLSILIISNLAFGFYMVDLVPPFKFEMYGIHKSFGVLILFLIALRLIIRFSSRIPALPMQISQLEAIMAKLGIFALYVCMICMPLSGYLASNLYGHPVLCFGLQMPSLASADQELGQFFGSAHTFFGYVFSIIIAGHVLFTVKHLIIDKINLLKRMV